jgi:HEAT repeat protein
MVLHLAWITDSEQVVSAAYWTGIICFIMAALLVLLVVLMRISWLDDQRRKKRFLKKWRPLLDASARGNIPRKFPFLFRADRLYFLEYWNYLQDKSDPASRDNLNKAASQLGMDRVARHLMRSRFLWRQLLGITTLGHLRDEHSYQELHELAMSDDPVVSLSASRSLVQMRPQEAISAIVPTMSTRYGWAPARVASLLTEAGTQNVCGPLTEALAKADDVHKIRLIHYIGATECPGAMDAVRAILGEHRTDRNIRGEESVVTAALKILNGPRDAELARPYLGHPNWHIRMEAIRTVGRIGDESDVKRLVMLLKDDHWWVRYRAAQALISMPSVSIPGVQRLLEEHKQEPATQDILRHVLAEKRFA